MRLPLQVNEEKGAAAPFSLGQSPAHGEPALSAQRRVHYACADGRTALSPPQTSRTTRHPFTHAAEGSPPMTSYRDFHRRSIEQPEEFWRDEARRIHWQTPFDTVLDRSNPPFARWFVGGRTNLCHNAVDRHMAERAAAERADLRVDGNRHRAALHLRRAVRRNQPDGRGDALARREARRRRADLSADDPRGAVRHAGLRAARRDPLGGVRRLRGAQPGGAHRRCQTRADRHRRCRRARRQSDRLHAAGRRSARARDAQDAACAADRPATRTRAAERATIWSPTSRCASNSSTPTCRANGSNRTSHRMSCTPRARPASRRACSATSAAMRWRWRHRWNTSFRATPATRCSPHRTWAGWSATATSSTRR